MVSDSCFSGSLIDQEKEQIGPAALSGSRSGSAAAGVRVRFIPYAEVLAHLSGASGVDVNAITDHVATHLVALFHDDASTKFHSHRRHKRSTDAHAGILLSGCQKDELSADVPPRGNRLAHGAFTDALHAVLEEHPAPISNRNLVRGTRDALGKQRFKQHPCLYCSDAANADAPFLGQHDTQVKSN